MLTFKMVLRMYAESLPEDQRPPPILDMNELPKGICRPDMAAFRYALASYGTTRSPDGHRTPNQSTMTFHWYRTKALQKDLDRFDREPSFHVAALLPFSNLAKKLSLDRLVRVGINS